MKHLLLFGGTFDPVHWGHIRIAQAVQKHWHFDQCLFLPCKTPVLKTQAQASAQDRINMLKNILKYQPKTYHFAMDCREIERKTPSYTVTTLLELRKEYGYKMPITLLLGYDAFCELPQWHQWKTVLTLANILVIARHDHGQQAVPDVLKELMDRHIVNTPVSLSTETHGCIFMFDAGHYEISSSRIRQALMTQENCDPLIPFWVMQYIKKNHLYRLK